MKIIGSWSKISGGLLLPALLFLILQGCIHVKLDCGGTGKKDGAGQCNSMAWANQSAQGFTGIMGDGSANQPATVPAGFTCNGAGTKCQASPGRCSFGGPTCQSLYNYQTTECWCGCP